MKRALQALAPLAIAIALALGGCGNRASMPQLDQGVPDATIDAQGHDGRVDGPPLDAAPDGHVPPCAPCTSPSCCISSQLHCYGDPNKGIVCTCHGYWTCDKDLKTCQHPLLTPDASATWSCSWSSTEYSCRTGSSWSPPPGGVPGWSCSYDSGSAQYKCKTPSPPNPCNKQSGVALWSCKVETAKGLLCTSPGTPPPPPCAAAKWSCSKESSGLEFCKRIDATGLPPGGSGWTCHRATLKGVSTWICQGSASANPQGKGWACAAASTGYRCLRAVDACDGPPKTTGAYACYMGSAFSGTRCEGVAGGCVPGQRQWCDGQVYSGWGQVECDTGGKWKTTTINGKTMIDCKESLAGSQGPVTPCACYHFYFNPLCCQRTDCVLPKGAVGQTCSASAGGLCDHCNPMKPECKESGAKCIVSNSHETYCGWDCTIKACPPDYTCMTVKLKVGTTKQCIPKDFSCYL